MTLPTTVETTRLANGFRIVTEHMPGLGSAALGIWIEAGANHERVEENGIAHFLEHMAFKGTARRSALAIAEEIEDVGGYLNAYTSRERTAYYARVLPDDVPLALDILADILREPALAEGEIETERGVILQEIGQCLDTPDDVIFDWLQETAFPDQPMGRAILGPPERVRAFSRTDLSGFIGRHYRPGQMILSAAGAVDHDAIVRLAESLFADMAPQPRSARAEARYGGGERRVEKELEQAHFALALPAPAYADPDFHAAQILATTLGGGMSSRLFQEAREKRGLCYAIFAQAAAWADCGLFMVYAGTGAEDVGELANLTADELARAAADLSETEIARARAQTKAGLVMGLESPSSRAERMAAMMSIWGKVLPLEETVAKIDAVDAAAARAVAARILAGPPSLALYGPVQRAPDAAALARRLAA
ncbi:pitrilysin family protein [Paralimibaculum aggregatum]|uniref:Pitrilysin family protein n=1 Tax=Paralimibaculum aggregatum TaxID=3036245 RepID=A0ABQ6LHB2_9RHOB|nr:pitrilysin family protein [Limibaculum sp. NKW23]GMG81821.1 pitrilysin family protein [Limibaculum sp. NKW23]